MYKLRVQLSTFGYLIGCHFIRLISTVKYEENIFFQWCNIYKKLILVTLSVNLVQMWLFNYLQVILVILASVFNDYFMLIIIQPGIAILFQLSFTCTSSNWTRVFETEKIQLFVRKKWKEMLLIFLQVRGIWWDYCWSFNLQTLKNHK